MKNFNRKGSALLIVLGMMAFLIASAVAFSAYMRSTRLPSSYLRRTVSSRWLVKSALAHAIDEIDAAIGNNPHPNVGTAQGRAVGTTGYRNNFWRGRVFVGGQYQNVGASGKSKDALISNLLIAQNETVPTLTLEGLAYIPPPLVNEARYYSRHTTNAVWHTLGFDTGRYAFTAIDVSDFFDINSVGATTVRGTSAKNRLSLSYLFENREHDRKPDSGVDSMDKWPIVNNQAPTDPSVFVSLADWNLYMGTVGFFSIDQNQKLPMQSFFSHYITGDDSDFYRGALETDENLDVVRRMTFVTDGYFPKTAATSSGNIGTYSMTDAKFQPFVDTVLENPKANFYDITTQADKNDILTQLHKSICDLGICALLDYLDPNSIPCSLAIPTTERVPMVAAIEPYLTFPLTVKETPGDASTDKDVQQGVSKTFYRKYTYRLDANAIKAGLDTSRLKLLLAYPFRHADGGTGTFTVDGRLSLFFSTGNVKLRTQNAADLIHFTNDKSRTSSGVDNNGVMHVVYKSQDYSPSAAQDESNAFKYMDLEPQDAATLAGDLKSNKVLLEVTYEKAQTWDSDANDWNPTDAACVDPQNITDAKTDFVPLKVDGTADTKYTGASLVQTLKNGAASPETWTLNAAVWARVTCKNADDADTKNKVVDFVPACMKDDVDFNGQNPNTIKIGQDTFGDVLYPILKFGTGSTLSFNAKPSASATVTLSPSAIMCADPRYNHAPEDWFAAPSGFTASDINAWLAASHRTDSSGEHRDGDIFMSVSDQYDLQSVYELANLPRLTDFYKSGAQYKGAGTYKTAASAGTRTELPSQFTDTLNKDNYWRTYDPIPNHYTSEGDDFENAGLSGSLSGMAVNPYSDSINVLMAALANTPHDWRMTAEANEIMASKPSGSDAVTFNREHSWARYSTGAHLAWDDLEHVAEAFQDDLRDSSNSGKTWDEVFKNLGWYKNDGTDSKCLLDDQDLSTSDSSLVYRTDKKFLYGYWRDCFATRQQLFLVFVRAEPSLMGGGAVGQTPPQLGGRAVALVWRDPTATANSETPHRTRVLFYRQFD